MSELRWKDLLSRRFDSPNQALITREVSQRLGAAAAAMAFIAGLSPNAVTILGLVAALVGCVPFIYGDSAGSWLVAAVLWQVAFALDCADGQLARATQRGSRFGAWLDVSCDHVRQSALAISVFAVVAADIDRSAAALCAFAFAAGMSVYLHTATLMHTLKPPGFNAPASMSTLRTVVQILLDAPVLLLLLCLLRPWPTALAIFAGIYGLLLMLRAAAIGRSRLGA